jgi:hypothetical protein
MDIIFKNHDLILFDPPYFGRMIKYIGETLTIKDYGELLSRVVKYKFISFNDELYLIFFVDCFKYKYIIKRGGFYPSRTELMITNIITEVEK